MRVFSVRNFAGLLSLAGLFLLVLAGLAVQHILAAPAGPVQAAAGRPAVPGPLGTGIPSPISTGMPTPVGTGVPSPVVTNPPSPLPSATRPAPTPRPGGSAATDVCVRLMQDPDTALPPGGVFTYTLVVQNIDRGDALGPGVRIPLDPNVEVRDFHGNGAYVDYLGADAVSVRFGDLPPNGVYSAQVIARIRPTAPANARLVSRAGVFWDDSRIHRTQVSNAITSVVGPLADSGAHGLQQRLAGAPPAPVAAGTLVTLRGDFFGGEEALSFWVNRPDNSVAALAAGGRTDRSGAIRLAVDTGGWAAGAYSLVAHGLCTGAEGTAALTIR